MWQKEKGKDIFCTKKKENHFEMLNIFATVPLNSTGRERRRFSSEYYMFVTVVGRQGEKGKTHVQYVEPRNRKSVYARCSLLKFEQAPPPPPTCF